MITNQIDRTIVASDLAGELQTLNTAILLTIINGTINVPAMARKELANRGLDGFGRWVGFIEAARFEKEWLAERNLPLVP